MIQQFNRLFPTKKRLSHTTKTTISSQVFSPTQSRKPCFRNFDFVAPYRSVKPGTNLQVGLVC